MVLFQVIVIHAKTIFIWKRLVKHAHKLAKMDILKIKINSFAKNVIQVAIHASVLFKEIV